MANIAKMNEKKGVPAGNKRNSTQVAVKALSRALANSYTLQLLTQNYHWNVTGPHFQQLHLMFQGQYEELFAAVDEVAERIRALGSRAPGSYSEFEALATLKEDKTPVTDWKVMVKRLATAHEQIAGELREDVGAVQDSGDEGTADLFIGRMQAHEKAAWMLRSVLE